jgi:copper(I)-binding protein
MANQAKRWGVVAAASLFAGQSGVFANVTNDLHRINYDALTIEHAELDLTPDGATDKAYVTVYNGSPADMAIVSVKVTGYSTATLMSPMVKSKGFEQVPLADTYVVIPRKAELDMGPDSVFISLVRSSGPPKAATMTLEFDDGSSRAVPLDILAPDETETNHHHGEPDRE